MADIRKWQLAAGDNDFNPPDGWPEGMKRSDVNNCAREVMRAVRAWYENPEFIQLMVDANGDLLTVAKFDASTIRISGADMTAYFTDNRRLKFTGGTPDPVYAFVTPGGAVFSGGNTDVTVDEFTGHTEVPPGMDAVLLGPQTLGRMAYLNTGALGIYSPVTQDSAGIQAAIDAANTDGGGIVALAADDYAIDAQIVMKANVALWGEGESSTVLTIDAALVDHPISVSSDCSLVGFSIDCSLHSGAYDALNVVSASADFRIENLRIISAAQDGVHIGATGVVNCLLRNLYIENPGQHGISIEDTNSDARGIFMESIYVDDPGAAVNEAAGIYWGGLATISNVQVRMTRATPSIQRGIWSRPTQAAEPNDQSGRLSAVRGFSIIATSTANEARGLEIEGRDVVFADGAIDCGTASLSQAIRLGSSVGGEFAEWNRLSNIICRRCNYGVYMAAGTENTQLTDITVRDATASGMYIGGDYTRANNCFIDNGDTGITFPTGASENHFMGCDIRNWTTARITDSGTWNMYHRTSAGVFYYLSSNDTVVNDIAGPVEVTLMNNCLFPTKPDGDTFYKVTLSIAAQMASTNANDYQRVGVLMGTLHVYWSDIWEMLAKTYPGGDWFDARYIHHTFYVKPSVSETSLDVIVEKTGAGLASLTYAGAQPTGLSRTESPKTVATLYITNASADIDEAYCFLHIEEVASWPAPDGKT